MGEAEADRKRLEVLMPARPPFFPCLACCSFLPCRFSATARIGRTAIPRGAARAAGAIQGSPCQCTARRQFARASECARRARRTTQEHATREHATRPSVRRQAWLTQRPTYSPLYVHLCTLSHWTLCTVLGAGEAAFEADRKKRRVKDIVAAADRGAGGTLFQLWDRDGSGFLDRDECVCTRATYFVEHMWRAPSFRVCLPCV